MEGICSGFCYYESWIVDWFISCRFAIVNNQLSAVLKC